MMSSFKDPRLQLTLDQIFNTCNTQCKGFPKYMPKNVCRKVAARDDHACATCWNAEIAERCPSLDNSFAQQMCLCLPQNAPVFIGKCDPVCADSVVKPSDACVHVDKRDAQGESIIPWKHEGDDDEDDNDKRQLSCWDVPHGSCSASGDVKRVSQGESIIPHHGQDNGIIVERKGPPCGVVPKSSCGMQSSER